jgi:mRNA interferase RelE/StbE
VVTPFEVEFTEKAVDDLGQMPKPIAQRVLDKIHWLADNFESITPTGLSHDLAGIFKLRIGDYRALYMVVEDSRRLRVLRVRHRRDVYENL